MSVISRHVEGSLPELYAFNSREDMTRNGFNLNGQHPSNPNKSAWCKGMGVAPLYGRTAQKVAVDRRLAHHHVDDMKLFDILRSRQMTWGEQAVWIEFDDSDV